MWTRLTSILVLITIGIITLFFTYQLQYLRFDFEVERFFPMEHEETHFYNQFRQEFGNDSDYIVIGITNQIIYDSLFLSKINRLSKALKNLEQVAYVLSPTEMKDVLRIKFPPKIIQTPILHFKNPSRYQQDSIRITKHRFFKDNFINVEGKAVQLFVQHQAHLTELECHQLSHEIQNLVDQFEFEKSHISGKCFGQTNYMAMIKQEVLLFVSVSSVFVMILLWFIYRRFWNVALPLTIVSLTVIWTIGLLCFFDKPIYLITNTIPTLLLVIGISDAVHLTTIYLQKVQYVPAKTALRLAIQEVGFATILTTVTTAIGFLTMLSSNFTQLIDLGIFATIGLLIAFLLTYTILPAFITLFPNGIIKRPSTKTMFLSKKLEQLAVYIARSTNQIITISFVLFIIGMIGISNLKTDNYMLDDLSESHSLIQSFRFFETHFSGTRPLEIALTIRDTSQSIYGLKALKEIEKVEQYLNSEYGAHELLSIATSIKYANQIQHFGKKAYYSLPQDQENVTFLLKNISKYDTTVSKNQFVSENKHQTRIIGKLPDWGGHKTREKNKSFRSFILNEIPNAIFEYRFTGTMHLIDLNNIFLVQNILIGLLIAILLIGSLIGILFRSLQILFITMICNVLPLILVAGIMGFVGIDLKLSTGLIFIIAFGVAVDDSIHFLICYKKQAKKHAITEAVKQIFQSTGKAISITTFILVGGFFSLCLSNFLGIFYIGFFVALTLIIAFILDFTLLPALLLKYHKS